MENKGFRLIKCGRHFSPNKLQSFSSFSRRSQLTSDNLHGDGVNLDDWELIEVLDQEFSGEKDEEDVDMIELIEVDDPFSPFLRFGYNHKTKTIKYTILSKVDVGRLLDGKISMVSTVLSLSRSEAIVLLQHFNWGVSKVHDEWLTSEEEVRKAVGLFERPVMETCDKDQTSCSLCHEGQVADNMFAVSCGHQICLACWTVSHVLSSQIHVFHMSVFLDDPCFTAWLYAQHIKDRMLIPCLVSFFSVYISEAINDGPGCLTLRCPTPLCEAAVGIGLIELVSNQEDVKRFNNHLFKSYVAGSRKIKRCPAPGCEYAAAVAFPNDADRNNDVTCNCLHSFCWNCCKEAHAPINCVTVNEWLSESHVQSTNCDAFSEDAAGNEDTDDDGMKMAAGSSLKRFSPYYEGWSCSEAARANAVMDYKVLKDIRMELLCGYLAMAETELEFLVEAHIQVVSSYQLLKWMYVYKYYQPEEEFLKTNLIEFMLEQAVTLVRMLEKHVSEFEEDALAVEIPSSQLGAFRGGLIQLTRVTRHYFERLVEAMYNDLSEVVSISRASPKANTDEVSCSSPGLRTSPSRRVIKTEAEEGMSGPAVNMKSEVLIPGTSSQKDPKLHFKFD
ncbi:hypothetical protein KSS87_004322 [Heliosperma pusillum]|nr:hypothetical protein KSS87_004322 [Heliosperma pusillum]